MSLVVVVMIVMFAITVRCAEHRGLVTERQAVGGNDGER